MQELTSEATSTFENQHYNQQQDNTLIPAKHLAQGHTRRVDIVTHIIHRNAHSHCNVGIAVPVDKQTKGFGLTHRQALYQCKHLVGEVNTIRALGSNGKSKESRNINLALDNIKAQIIKHDQRISDREAFVTAEMVRNAYQGIETEYETLLRAFDKENEAFAKRVG